MINFLKGLFNKPVPANQYYLSICCIIKDENKYLEEWMGYHLKAGVEHFYIYDNGSAVPIAQTIKELNLEHCTTVKIIQGQAKQVKAYGHCLKNFGPTSRWIAFIDTDEFIVAKASGGNLPAFLKDYEHYGGLGVNWQIFGSNGHLKKTNRPQLESFTLRAKEDFHINRHIKSIVQPRYVKAAHNAHSFVYIKDMYCVNENFERINDSFNDVSINKIQLNHYFCRSLEEFEEKIKRGIADTRKGRTLEQFHHHNDGANDVEDKTILEFFEA
jgi:hypothetical protein